MMTFAEKITLLCGKAPAVKGSRPRWAFYVAKYLQARTSRFGLKQFVQRSVLGKHYQMHFGFPNQCSISARLGDFGDFTAWNEVFVDRVYELDRLAFKPELILDAGAHIGAFSVLAHCYFQDARIISIEPVQANFMLLTKNISSNQVPAELHNCALADYEGTGLMRGDSSVGSQLLIVPNSPGNIPVRRLSSLVNLDKVQSLLLKCDTEGMEFQILSDILPKAPSRAAVFLESHGGRAETQRLRGLLENEGFSFAVTRSRGVYEDCIAVRHGKCT